jgi:hypothetical protein
MAAGPAWGESPQADTSDEGAKKAYLSLAQERAGLERENRLLGLELELAERDSAYAVFDLGSRKLRIKLKGVEVRTYNLLDLTFAGNLAAWPDSLRGVAGPFPLVLKEDFGPPPVPFQPKPRSPLDILPPDPIDPTPCFYGLHFGEGFLLRVTPGDSAFADRRSWIKRVSGQALTALAAVRERFAVALGWEAEDPRIHISCRLPFDQSQALFRTARIGLPVILLY